MSTTKCVAQKKATQNVQHKMCSSKCPAQNLQQNISSTNVSTIHAAQNVQHKMCSRCMPHYLVIPPVFVGEKRLCLPVPKVVTCAVSIDMAIGISSFQLCMHSYMHLKNLINPRKNFHFRSIIIKLFRMIMRKFIILLKT